MKFPKIKLPADINSFSVFINILTCSKVQILTVNKRINNMAFLFSHTLFLQGRQINNCVLVVSDEDGVFFYELFGFQIRICWRYGHVVGGTHCDFFVDVKAKRPPLTFSLVEKRGITVIWRDNFCFLWQHLIGFPASLNYFRSVNPVIRSYRIPGKGKHEHNTYYCKSGPKFREPLAHKDGDCRNNKNLIII